jgi:hypothetical protein
LACIEVLTTFDSQSALFIHESEIFMTIPNELLCSVLLFAAASTHGQVAVQNAQNGVDKQPSIQVFLTAAFKNGSLAVLDRAELEVSIDKKPAHISMLRSAKSDPLLFAVLVDRSKSETSAADSIKKAALQLFERLSGI